VCHSVILKALSLSLAYYPLCNWSVVSSLPIILPVASKDSYPLFHPLPSPLSYCSHSSFLSSSLFLLFTRPSPSFPLFLSPTIPPSSLPLRSGRDILVHGRWGNAFVKRSDFIYVESFKLQLKSPLTGPRGYMWLTLQVSIDMPPRTATAIATSPENRWSGGRQNDRLPIMNYAGGVGIVMVRHFNILTSWLFQPTLSQHFKINLCVSKNRTFRICMLYS